jgi:hypothetical protein
MRPRTKPMSEKLKQEATMLATTEQLNFGQPSI